MGHSTELKRENWLMVYGTNPTSGVNIDTKMVKNVLEQIRFRQDKLKKVAHLPGVFDQMKTDDAKFEITASNSIERLALYNKNSKFKAKFKNEVGETIGLIIVNTKVPNFLS